MKITAINTFLCHAYRTNWVFVKVETDTGIHGVGEATLEYREKTVIAAIDDLAYTLVGQDAGEINKMFHDSYRDAYWRGGPVLMSAISGVEMALWDIKGKSLGVPVYELLGGKMRDGIPCYANGWFTPAKTPEEFAAKARIAAGAGFQGLKWDPFGSAWQTLTRAELSRAMDCVGAVSDAVGDRADLFIEGHGRFNIPTAVEIGRELEHYKIRWFEEPIPPDNLEGLAEVKKRIRVSIAAGERLYSRWDYRRLFELHCADFIQPDVSHAGGIGELIRIAAIAESYHIPICPHNPSGPVANAATLQLAACLPNLYLLETMATDVPHRREITNENVRFENGKMLISDKPGLGIEINENAIQKYPYQPQTLRHYRGDLTDIRPENATSYFENNLQKGK
jgi:galactonate dehydratase